MRREFLTRTAPFCTAIIIAAALLARGGDLNPPAGPVSPTMKTLTAVEPRTPIGSGTTPGDADSVYRIGQSGSYYLTGDVIGVPGRHGLEVAASDVTIDLMGYTVRGVAGSLNGIRSDGAPRSGLTIRNGGITAWGAGGLNLIASPTGNGILVEQVHVRSNGSHGIRVGSSGIVRSCTAVGNGGTGILGDNNVVVVSCVARSNGIGISVGVASVVRACSSQNNTGDGFNVGDAGRISDCSAVGNGGEGFDATNSCIITLSIALSNMGDGFEVDGGSILLHNVSNTTGASPPATAILANLGNNRIDGNTIVTTATAGVASTASSSNNNLIIRNLAAGSGLLLYDGIGDDFYGEPLNTEGAMSTRENAMVNIRNTTE